MLKILAVTDKENSAIYRLAKGVEKYHSNLNYVVVDYHPKRPSQEQVELFEKESADADILHFMYFRTAEAILQKYPELNKKKRILDMYNPYSITESDWNHYDAVVGCNKEIYENLGKITKSATQHIPLTIDTDFWTFKREWQSNKTVLMVANRIESKKGILEVAQACQELNLKMMLVGAVSDMDYFKQILRTGVVEFRQEITDEELKELYRSSTLHVCNSIDNFESGTLPILEAMLCGTPVLTRKIGHVPELFNGENMLLNEGQPEDIKKCLEEAFKSVDKLDSMRQRAWDTAKTRSNERRAYMYHKLYREVMWPDQKSVSVVMPVYGKPNAETVEAVLKQSYQNLELIICNDDENYRVGSVDPLPSKRLIRFINQPSKGYGLAKQRNLGIIEATGDIIVFCDQRMKMELDAVEELVKYLAPTKWVYGNKGTKKEFVENFSAVYREDIIRLGMFNERINAYGGMSQYIRSVAKYRGLKLEFVESAKATPQGNSKNKYTKRQEIIKMKNLLWKINLEM